MVENKYLDFLGIIGYELEFLIENNDAFYYICEVSDQTDYVEIFAVASDKDDTLTGDIGVLPVHKGANTFTIELLENGVLSKTFDLSVVVKNCKRSRQRKELEKTVRPLDEADIEAEDIQGKIEHWEAEETIWKKLQELPQELSQEPVDLKLEKRQEHITPPRLLHLNVINGVLEPAFQADVFEYRLKRKKNKDKIVIKAEGEQAEYIVDGDLGGRRLSEEEQTFCIRCSCRDHSLEMVYRLHVDGIPQKIQKIPKARKRPGAAKRPEAAKGSGVAKGPGAPKGPGAAKGSGAAKGLGAPKAPGAMKLPKALICSGILFMLAVTLCLVLRKPLHQIALAGEPKNVASSFSEDALLELLDTWKKEVALEYMEVTISPQSQERGAPLKSRIVSVEAEGSYDELLQLYGITYKSYKHILIGHLELEKDQENVQADIWTMRFNLIFY